MHKIPNKYKYYMAYLFGHFRKRHKQLRLMFKGAWASTPFMQIQIKKKVFLRLENSIGYKYK